VYHIAKVGGICNIDTSNKQMLACGNARQKYAAYLEERKVKKTQAATAWKRKAVSGEVDKLKTKRQKLETDRSHC